MENQVLINIEYFQTANYSLVHNHIPICQKLEITNSTDDALCNVSIRVKGDYIAEKMSAVIPSVSPGTTLSVRDVEIMPDAARLVELTEKVVTNFTVEVMSGNDIVCSKVCDIELMTFDQWLGTGIIPACLASFVMPNLPAVNALVVKAAKVLKDQTGESSFTGYLSGNPDVVLRQTAAVFKALHDEGIIYRTAPASFETVGQRLTLPDQVLSGKIGNCIELTLLMASVLENIGINPIIMLMGGHAYLGVWLVEDCYAHSVGDDLSFIEKKCAKGLNEIIVLESTMITAEDASFEKAISAAEKHLLKPQDFEMFLDIHRCRLERYLPMPVRMAADGSWTVDTDGVEHGEADAEIPHHTRFDLNKVGNQQNQLTKFDIWERKLLDFSLRNAMLNLSVRRKAVQFISFDVDKIEDHLQDGEEYCIMQKPDIKLDVDDEKLIRSKLVEPLKKLITDDIEHHVLHTYHPEGETQTILKNIYRTARTSIEETGANSLFLAIGTLRWYENERSEQARYAPILMLPVEMVYKKGHYYVRTRDEEAMLNITLFEFLRQNYSITINGLSPLPKDDHGIDVLLLFTLIRDALKDQPRWDVEEECLLGTFSFSKFLMWNDVHNNREQLVKSPVVESLVKGRLTWKPEEMQTQLREKDKTMHPSEMALPVAVDSSQMTAVYEAGLGNSFILYGPPGTGKSQTITNLIANALYHGKRVLFVAEKMAALSVVQKRLEKIGLGPFCLELHSNKVTKKHVLDQLALSLGVTHIQKPADYQATADKLYEQRKKMIAYLDALHTPGTDGFSIYDCIVRYEAVSANEMDISSTAQMTAITSASIKDYEEKLGSPIETITALVGKIADHPLRQFIINQNALANQSGVSDLLAKAVKIIDGIAATAQDEQLDMALELIGVIGQIKECSGADISFLLNSSSAKSLRELKDKQDLCESKRKHILSSSREELLKQDGTALSMEWYQIQNKWFLPRFFASRSFVQKMRFFSSSVTKSDVGSLIDNLCDYQKHSAECQEMQKNGAKAMESLLNPEEAKAKLLLWRDNLDSMRDWYQWCEYRQQLKQMQLDTVVKEIERGVFSPGEIKDAFIKGFFKRKAMEKISADKTLCTFEGIVFEEVTKIYRKCNEEFQTLCKKELYARLAANIPRVTDNLDNSSELGLLNRNISNGGRGLSLRDLFDQIPGLLPRLCPCMLMSPMSVAQYIDLGQDKFDLVIFDEASQMPTSEAIGAIARGKALIVVGDPKQMPPTSFFSSTNVDEEEADIDDMESILEDCRTLSIPALQLSWHYRSRHESLIAFSNNEYYDGSLITFPSTDDKKTKVSFVPVNGFYDKGGKRCNRAEAEAIVKEIERRLLDKELRKFSIGVIAFSVVQQNLIEDLLNERIESDKKLSEIADGMYEPIFVKNLENAQGDERDVILFSIGYGPNKEGVVSMNFGPLNNAGGERRLNVAVSRARHEMMVFSTLHASQIDLRRSQAKGVEGLKHFLEYAEFQTLSQVASANKGASDLIVAQQIGKALTAKGYDVQYGIGRSQFKVDLAITDRNNPESYSLGILLDGENYRNTQTTRDREIVQPSVLESLSWNVMRVWSVDWFNNPSRVISRIEKAIEELPEKKEEKPAETEKFDISGEEVEEIESKGTPYTEYHHDGKVKTTDAIVKRVIAAEQPVMLTLLTKRVAVAQQLPRVTPTLQEEVRKSAAKFHMVPDRQSFAVYMSQEDADTFDGYRTGSGRDIGDIPMVEIRNVITDAVKQQVSLDEGKAVLIAAKILGFTRRGTNVDAAFHTAISELVSEGILTQEDGRLS